MKFGLQHPNFTFDGEGPEIVDKLKTLVQRAESVGFDSFWVMDHFHQIQMVGKAEEPMLEGWTTQSVVAGFTRRIKLIYFDYLSQNHGQMLNPKSNPIISMFFYL